MNGKKRSIKKSLKPLDDYFIFLFLKERFNTLCLAKPLNLSFMKIKLLFLLLVGGASLHAGVSVGNEFKVGTVVSVQQSFLSGIKSIQINDLTTYKTIENYNDNNKSSGTIEGYKDSQYFICKQDNKIEGFIILSVANNEAYQYSTNEKNEVVLNKISVDKLLCTNYNGHKGASFNKNEKIVLGGSQEIPPILNSLPGSNYVMYLDFDGYNLPSGTGWNGGNSLTAQSSGLSNQQIAEIWNIIAEDYAPYTVNVTTDESAFLSAPLGQKMRVVFTVTSSWYPNAGGVAFVTSFSFGNETPCWVFVDRFGYSFDMAEAGSHELGHTVGLSHDGNAGNAYYSGHNDWGPIMGTGYGRNVSQFSMGEYATATNTEDDLQIISTFVPYKNDDHADNNTLASALNYSINAGVGIIDAASNFGLIGNRNDIDVFKIQSMAGGNLNLTIKPSAGTSKTNLDVEIKLYDSQNNLVSTKGTGHVNIINGVTFTTSINGGETYYLKIDGVGTGDPLTGWSDYNSMGPYTISGTVEGMQPKQYDMAVSKISGISNVGCGNSIDPVIEIANVGIETIQQVTLEILFDNVVVETINYNTLLLTGGKATIYANNITLINQGNNIVSARVSNPNGVADEENLNDLLNFPFSKNFGSLISFKISEASLNTASMAWTIQENNNIIVSSNLTAAKSEGGFSVQEFCLQADKCYDFSISNAFKISCSQYTPWNGATIYKIGDQFSYNGRLYSVKSQIWNANPIGFPQYYNDLGACPYLAPTDYFAINDEDQQTELLNKTVLDYTSPYNDNFCLISTSIQMLSTSTELQYYPNPVSNQLSFSQTIEKITLYDLNGKFIEQYNNANAIDFSNLNQGIYFIATENKTLKSNFKIVKM